MSVLNQRKLDARFIFLLMSAGTSFFTTLVFSVNMVYQVNTVGLSPLQLVLVGTALEVTIFLFEVPTGIVADVYSRRLSILIGYVLIGLGFMLEGLVPRFGAILLAQVLWGFGWTFTSGATEAWIVDEIGEAEAGPLFLRASQLSTAIGIVGTVVAVLIGSLLINLPIVLGGLLFVGLALLLTLTMPETGFTRNTSADHSPLHHFRRTLGDGYRTVRGHPVLIAILGIGLFFGLYSEGFDRLNTAHLLESFTLPDILGLQPVAWIGAIGIIGSLLSIGVMQVVRKRLDMTSGRSLARASYALGALLVAALLGFALAGSLLVAVILRWAITVIRTLGEPIEAAWINQYIPSSVRATVISMRGQVDALGQMGGGPPIGLVGDTFGIRAALAASGLILSPVLYLYARLLRGDRMTAPAVPAEKGNAP